MNPAARQGLSAAGLLAVVGLLAGGAASTALGLRDDRASLAALTAQDEALDARARRNAPKGPLKPDVSPFVKADTITLAGAVLQQRVENAVAEAGGHLASSQVEVGGAGDAKRVALEAELTIAQPDMQKLLFDLETGQPYLVVETLEARAPENFDAQGSGDARVSLKLAGEWGGRK